MMQRNRYATLPAIGQTKGTGTFPDRKGKWNKGKERRKEKDRKESLKRVAEHEFKIKGI